jgi:hypothetical protein
MNTYINLNKDINTSDSSMRSEAEFQNSDNRLGTFVVKAIFTIPFQRWEKIGNTHFLRIFLNGLNNLTTKMATIQTHINDIENIIDNNDIIANRLSVLFKNYIYNNRQSENTEILLSIRSIFNSIWNGVFPIQLSDTIKVQYTMFGPRYTNFIPGVAIFTILDLYTIFLKHSNIIGYFKELHTNLISPISQLIGEINTLISTLDSEYNTLNDAYTTKLNNYNQNLLKTQRLLT